MITDATKKAVRSIFLSRPTDVPGPVFAELPSRPYVHRRHVVDLFVSVVSVLAAVHERARRARRQGNGVGHGDDANNCHVFLSICRYLSGRSASVRHDHNIA
jgi:hypothetical protein